MNRKMRAYWVCAVAAAAILPAFGEGAVRETLRYVRRSGDTFATECRFVVAQAPAGWSITSWTDRGAVGMEIKAEYDVSDRPLSARAVLTTGGLARAVNVHFTGGTATVQREGQQPIELEAPAGTIVTSAPDWTDVFLLCRRYNRARKGLQEFPALWIHPTQTPRRLTFSIERQGADLIERDGKKVELGRYSIRIRNNSSYTAWADAEGRMIRLMPQPSSDPAAGLTLEGYEKPAAGLRPAP